MLLSQKDDSSLDAIEVKKFEFGHSDWWAEHGEFHVLHKITPLRVRYILDAIESHVYSDAHLTGSIYPRPRLKILDVGCGGGLLSVPLAMNGYDITALDVNIANLEALRTQASRFSLDIHYIHSTLETHVSSNNKYEVVLCFEVVEHVANLGSFIKNLVSILKPGGIIILSTINRTIKSYGLAIIVAEYLLSLIKNGTHNYKKFVKPSELAREFEKHNCTILDLKGLKFDLITRNWQMSEDVSVNYFASIAHCK